MKYAVYTLLSLMFLSGCGPAAQAPSQGLTKQLPPSSGASEGSALISVSLDDAFTTVTPNGSERVELTDARYFTPPSALNIVQGSYAGSNPGQYLHARLIVGAEQCEYQANGIGITVLGLQFCSGGIGPNTYLASGAVIELVNYDCPGFLVEANFTLSR